MSKKKEKKKTPNKQKKHWKGAKQRIRNNSKMTFDV